MSKKKPPTLPGELWRGEVDMGHGRKSLCAVCLPDDEPPSTIYLDFGPHCPTVAQWFTDATGKGDWVTVDESDHGAVYAACLRAMRPKGA
mgnify:CR=1 FL=1